MSSRFVFQSSSVSSEDLRTSDARLPGLIQQHLAEYRAAELRKREARLVEKLRDCREQLAELGPEWEVKGRAGQRPGRGTTSLTSLRGFSEHLGVAGSSESNLLTVFSPSCVSLTSLSEPQTSPPHSLRGTLDVSEINEQDARIREKNIIEYETLQQEEGQGLGDFLTKLQHLVVAAYGDEGTPILQKRVAWAFIRGVRDPSVRCFLVAQGWTTSNTEALSPKDILELALMSPVIKCEGILKRKITKTPPDVKSVEKSWASFYTVLKSNTIFFYKDMKYFKRDEYESACDLTKEATVEMESERKGVKLIRVSKENGLEMLLRIKTENQTGVKCSSFESWLENLCLSTGSPCTVPGIKNSQNSVSTSDITSPDNLNGTNRHILVDRRSIIDCKEITKKDISEFLNRKMEKHSNSKSSIQKLLEDQGIDISHLDKSKKKEVLNRLLTSRPSFSDLEKKGLIKYTVFGCPLSKLCSRQKVLVPSVITQCIEAIEHRGLKSAGIYRISGNSASIQKLRFKFDKEEPVDLKDDEYDINMLTGSLKLFLRELPEPIIPFRQFAAVESAIRGGDSTQQDCLGSLKQIVHDLPEPNKSTFKYIILHIVRVAHESDNQMDDHNLSIIFGPSLLGNYPDKANLLVDLPVQNNAIEKIISNFKTIFR